MPNGQRPSESPVGRLMPLLTLLVACAGSHVSRGTDPESIAGNYEYTVRTDDALERIDVTLCFEGAPPDRLAFGRAAAEGALLRAELRPRNGGARPLARRGPSILLDGVGRDACVGYIMNLRHPALRSFHAPRTPDTAVVDGAAWLLRPVPQAATATGTVRFDLPLGMNAATAWPRAGNGYRVGPEVFRFLSHTVLGRFEYDTANVDGAEIRIARLPGAVAMAPREINAWIRETAQGVATIHGRFPSDRALVVLVPVAAGPDSIAFGHVGRGGGPSIMLLLRENADRDALRSDWVAAHEFSHLVAPFVRREGAWLSEGLATYYQEIVRARSGNQSPLDAWQALDEGFRRAQQGGTGRILSEESRHMFRTRSFQRVYWAGTALALLMDVRLRRRAGRVASLDDALGELSRCCARTPWEARPLIARMDRILGAPLAGALVDPHLASPDFPDMGGIYQFLGLRRTHAGLLMLEPDAPGAAIRDAIMSDDQIGLPANMAQDQGRH